VHQREPGGQALATVVLGHGAGGGIDAPDLKAATEAWIRDAFPEAGPAGKLPLP